MNTTSILSVGTADSIARMVRWPVTSILKRNWKPELPSEYTSGKMSLDRLAAVPAVGFVDPSK